MGVRTACSIPPPSPRKTTSGARMSTSCCRSPVSAARWNAASASRVSARETIPRGRRAATCARARCAIWRTAAGLLSDGFGDLVVAEVEHLAQHEDRPLGRREGLEHQQHRHRDAVGQLDVLGHVRRGEQRLGQPRADVGLLAAAERAQPGQRLAGGDPDQVRPLVPDDGEIDARPPQPGLLQDVLGVGGRAEHLVGDGEQQVAVGDERLGGGVGRPSRAAIPARLRRAGHGGSCSLSTVSPTRRRVPPFCDTGLSRACTPGAVTRTGWPASHVRPVRHE